MKGVTYLYSSFLLPGRMLCALSLGKATFVFQSSSVPDALSLCNLVVLPPATAFLGSLPNDENVVSTNSPTSLLMYGVNPETEN